MKSEKDFKILYLKYKKKYLNLKNKIGGTNPYQNLPSVIDRSSSLLFRANFDRLNEDILTIPNSGVPEGISGYSQQCMYISIYNYVTQIMNPPLNLTFLEFRNLSGLENDELMNQEFDIGVQRHVQAIETLSGVFDLDIRIWQKNVGDELSINSRGLFSYRYSGNNSETLSTQMFDTASGGIIPIGRYGEGNTNVVNISSGIGHFQLITGGSIFGEDARNIGSINPNLFISNGKHVSAKKLDKKEKEKYSNIESYQNEINKLIKNREIEKNNLNDKLLRKEMTDEELEAALQNYESSAEEIDIKYNNEITYYDSLIAQLEAGQNIQEFSKSKHSSNITESESGFNLSPEEEQQQRELFETFERKNKSKDKYDINDLLNFSEEELEQQKNILEEHERQKQETQMKSDEEFARQLDSSSQTTVTSSDIRRTDSEELNDFIEALSKGENVEHLIKNRYG